MSLNLFSSILSSNTNPTYLSALDSVYIALIGMALVFVMLGLLMFVIWLFGLIMQNAPKLAAKYPKAANFVPNTKIKIKSAFSKKKTAGNTGADAGFAEILPIPVLADGTCGDLKLIKTSERDAAMVMAIVADATETPLNQLKFISIKNVSEGENE